MFHNQPIFQSLMSRFETQFARQVRPTAYVRRTNDGARIQFSDGRRSWLAKEAHTTEDGFLVEVEQWIQRHGVGLNEITWG